MSGTSEIVTVIREALINLIFAVAVGQRNHCEASIEWDELP